MTTEQIPDSTNDGALTDDDIAALHDTPLSRLRAEMFTADDIDGVTESLTGSGNINYLILQSQQTNELHNTADPFNIDPSDFAGGLFDPAAIEGGRNGAGGGVSGGAGADSGGLDDLTALARIDGPESADPSFGAAEGGLGNSVSALSTFGASHFQAQFQGNSDSTFRSVIEQLDGVNGLDGVAGINGAGLDGLPGGAGTSGSDGGPGSPGNNGNDGRDGNDGGGPPDDPPGDDDDVDLQVDVISDVINADLDFILDPIEGIAGDIDIDVDVILGDILSTEDGILPNPSVILDALVGGIEILDEMQVDVILQPVENLLTDVVGAVNPVLTGLLPFLPDPMDLVGGVLDSFNRDGDTDLIIDIGLDLPDLLGLSGLGTVATHIPLDPLESILGDIDMAVSADSIVTNLLAGDVQGILDVGILSDGEFLSGIDAVISADDVFGSTVDSIENIADAVMNADAVGDIVDNVLDGDILENDQIEGIVDVVDDIVPLDSVTDVAGDLLGGILGGGADDDGGADTDLVVDTGIEALDSLLADTGIDVTLDAVENIVGDIDVDVSLETDIAEDILAGDVAGAVDEAIDAVTNLIDVDIALLNPEAGQDGGLGIDGLDNIDLVSGGLLGDVGDDLTSWPEAAIGDVLGDAGGGLLGDGDIAGLPEPEGILSEGLNLINETVSGGDSGGGLLGGLLGGGGGGLFG